MTAKKTRMETMSEAVERLESRGYRQSFRATSDGELEAGGERVAPENLLVDETVRFEGSSDPDGQAVLFALRTADDRWRGIFVSSFGPQVDPANAAVMQRLAPLPTGHDER